MELRHLRYFVKVAELLHFGRAAKSLAISQPPLSQQIRSLEAELGVQLLDRDNRTVTLTPAGRLFLEHARATLTQAELAVSAARMAGRGEVGQLVIGFSPSAPFTPVVAQAIHQFRESYPQVSVEWNELPGIDQIRAVSHGVVDVSLLRRHSPPKAPSELVVSSILSEPLSLVTSLAHPSASLHEARWSDLKDQTLLAYASDRKDGLSEEILGMLARAHVSPKVRSVSDLTTLFALAAAGLGVAVLPHALSPLHQFGLRFTPIAGASVDVWVIHRKKQANGSVRNFLKLLCPSLAGHQATTSLERRST